jgi:hypothetical protein
LSNPEIADATDAGGLHEACIFTLDRTYNAGHVLILLVLTNGIDIGAVNGTRSTHESGTIAVYREESLVVSDLCQRGRGTQ